MRYLPAYSTLHENHRVLASFAPALESNYLKFKISMDGLKTDTSSISRSCGCPLRYSLKTFRSFAIFLILEKRSHFTNEILFCITHLVKSRRSKKIKGWEREKIAVFYTEILTERHTSLT